MNGTRNRHITSALAGALACAVLLAGCGVLDPQEGASAAGGGDVMAISVGDCLDDGDLAGEVTTVPIVDCAEPHDSEVFARTEVSGTDFPGDDALDAELVAFCQGDAFTDFVGIPYVDSRYLTSGYYPTATSWARGDRELLCTIRADGAKTTGSLEGAAE